MLYLDTIMRFTQNDLFRHILLDGRVVVLKFWIQVFASHLTLLLRSSDSHLFWIGRSGSGCDMVQTCVIPSVTNLTQVRVTSWSTSSLPVRLLLHNKIAQMLPPLGLNLRLSCYSQLVDFLQPYDLHSTHAACTRFHIGVGMGI